MYHVLESAYIRSMSNLGHLSVHFQKAVVSEGVCVRVEGYKYIEKLERGAEGGGGIRKRKGRAILPAHKPLYFITRMRKLIRTETPPVALLGHQSLPLREEVYR